MLKVKTLEELREFILYLENKYNLIEYEIDGVKPWQLERVSIDYALSIQLGFMKNPHTTLTKKQRFLNLFQTLKSFLFKNPFFAKKSDVIIFSHARVNRVYGEYIDIYTHYFEQELESKGISYVEIEAPYIGQHLKKSRSNRFHKEFILVLKELLYRVVYIKEKDFDTLTQVEQEIEEKIGKYDLKSKLLTAIKKYKIEYFLYKKLLQKIQPKQVYVLVSYSGLGTLIKAAKDLDIEVIEFQHGNFSKYHFGYYFGEDKKNLDYFPDKFYVWNSYWKNLINFPIKYENIIIREFDYMKQRVNNYKHIQTVENRVVVLSQGAIGEKIAHRILTNWEYFKKFDIKYKLHPGEYERWREYPSLKILAEKSNVEIITSTDLYALFSSCEYQVGVFSTALSEGVEFGCKTILLNLHGVEEMQEFQKIYKVEEII